MSNTSTEHYKMFRNYMVNELGITKDDIKEWTKEAVIEVAQKQVGQIDISGIIVGICTKNSNEIRKLAISQVAEVLAQRLNISIEE